jgi:hypothetical protein
MRNLEVFKIGTSLVNEYEYQKSHGELTEQLHHPDEQMGGKRPTQAERVAQLMAQARAKVAKKKRQAARGKTSLGAKSAKSAARTGANKQTAAKNPSKTASKNSSKKSTARSRRATKK